MFILLVPALAPALTLQLLLLLLRLLSNLNFWACPARFTSKFLFWSLKRDPSMWDMMTVLLRFGYYRVPLREVRTFFFHGFSLLLLLLLLCWW